MEVLLTTEAAAKLTALETGTKPEQAKARKVHSTIAKLAANPNNPGLHTHPYEALGDKVFQSYVENNTPGAWRIWWWYGPDRGQLTVFEFGPHPG